MSSPDFFGLKISGMIRPGSRLIPYLQPLIKNHPLSGISTTEPNHFWWRAYQIYIYISISSHCSYLHMYTYMFQPCWPCPPPPQPPPLWQGGGYYSPCGMGGWLMNRLYRGAPGSCLLHRSFWVGDDPGGGPSGPGAGTYIYIYIYIYIYTYIHIYIYTYIYIHIGNS